MRPGGSRAAWCAVAAACAELLAAMAAAAGEQPVADAALLEFLGSVDSNMPGWHKYLADADVEHGAQRGSPVPVRSSRPSAPSAPSAQPPADPPANSPLTPSSPPREPQS